MSEQSIVAELLRDGDALWSSVECDVKRDRVVIYARLHANQPFGVERALAESRRVFESVLARYTGCHEWLAAVQWSDRLCKTFTTQAGGGPNWDGARYSILRSVDGAHRSLEIVEQRALRDGPPDAELKLPAAVVDPAD